MYYQLEIENVTINNKKIKFIQERSYTSFSLLMILLLNYCPNLRWQILITYFSLFIKGRLFSLFLSQESLIKVL